MKVYARDLRGIFIRVRLFESHKRNSIPHANPFMGHLKGLSHTSGSSPLPLPLLPPATKPTCFLYFPLPLNSWVFMSEMKAKPLNEKILKS